MTQADSAVFPLPLESGAGEAVGPRRLAARLGGSERPRYSLCTMVTDWQQYRECIETFLAKGFGLDDCEYVVLDNSSGNKADAYVAVNELLQAAQGDYIILMHQDVLLLEHGRERLDECLAELDRVDPNWALCGNSGHAEDGWRAVSIAHPYGERDIVGDFPERVVSLDENFIVVRKIANLAASNDLSGFHFYGPDLCIMADILGWNTYVIDFFLRHLSAGNFDERYTRSRQLIIAKYQRALRPRWVHLITLQAFFISGNPRDQWLRGARYKIAKAIGTIPRYRHLYDLEARARRRRLRK